MKNTPSRDASGNTSTENLANVATKCAICRTFGNSREIYPAHFFGEKLDEQAFSARRFYNEKIHFRMVKCNSCGLLRSDPIIRPEMYSKLYEGSKMNYEGLLINLSKTYGRYLKKYLRYTAGRKSLIEIGCGNGFFLKKAKEMGFEKVAGVEPSSEAIDKADLEIKPLIKKEMFRDGLYEPNSFDVFCIFQTLDHLLEPSETLNQAKTILKPGGIFFAINHNLNSLSSKILGEKSPIIDIEHTYLYNKYTIRKLFEKSGYEVVEIFYPWNLHSIGYLFSLLPIRPVILKSAIHKFLNKTRISNISVWVPLGNIGIVARKPLKSKN